MILNRWYFLYNASQISTKVTYLSCMTCLNLSITKLKFKQLSKYLHPLVNPDRDRRYISGLWSMIDIREGHNVLLMASRDVLLGYSGTNKEWKLSEMRNQVLMGNWLYFGVSVIRWDKLLFWRIIDKFSMTWRDLKLTLWWYPSFYTASSQKFRHSEERDWIQNSIGEWYPKHLWGALEEQQLSLFFELSI